MFCIYVDNNVNEKVWLWNVFSGILDVIELIFVVFFFSFRVNGCMWSGRIGGWNEGLLISYFIIVLVK